MKFIMMLESFDDYPAGLCLSSVGRCRTEKNKKLSLNKQSYGCIERSKVTLSKRVLKVTVVCFVLFDVI